MITDPFGKSKKLTEFYIWHNFEGFIAFFHLKVHVYCCIASEISFFLVVWCSRTLIKTEMWLFSVLCCISVRFPCISVQNISVWKLRESLLELGYCSPLQCLFICARLNSTLKLPWVTKTEFFLTKPIQYQADKWWEQRKILMRGLLVDLIPNALN